MGDPSSLDPKVLETFAHELVHALDDKERLASGKEKPVEELEYRAYLTTGVTTTSLNEVNATKVLPAIFGDFMMSGSCLGYYMINCIAAGQARDFADFMAKSKKGEIFIPWRSIKTK